MTLSHWLYKYTHKKFQQIYEVNKIFIDIQIIINIPSLIFFQIMIGGCYLV